jgi:hypothetical protein
MLEKFHTIDTVSDKYQIHDVIEGRLSYVLGWSDKFHTTYTNLRTTI